MSYITYPDYRFIFVICIVNFELTEEGFIRTNLLRGVVAGFVKLNLFALSVLWGRE
jgi:hypothetical protein